MRIGYELGYQSERFRKGIIPEGFYLKGFKRANFLLFFFLKILVGGSEWGCVVC